MHPEPEDVEEHPDLLEVVGQRELRFGQREIVVVGHLHQRQGTSAPVAAHPAGGAQRIGDVGAQVVEEGCADLVEQLGCTHGPGGHVCRIAQGRASASRRREPLRGDQPDPQQRVERLAHRADVAAQLVGQLGDGDRRGMRADACQQRVLRAGQVRDGVQLERGGRHVAGVRCGRSVVSGRSAGLGHSAGPGRGAGFGHRAHWRRSADFGRSAHWSRSARGGRSAGRLHGHQPRGFGVAATSPLRER